MIRVAVPALIVMLTIAGLVWAASWNRSGEPRLTLLVTERELPLDSDWDASRDAAGPVLPLVVQHRTDPVDARNWLPESRLRELGFDLDVPVGSPRAAEVYQHVPPRQGWVVLEYDGPAWRAVERQRGLESPDRPWREGASRLVPVDAGSDFELLRRRYPNGHLIVPAVFGLGYWPVEAGGPLVYGTLQALVPRHVRVPAGLRPVFEEVSPSDGGDAEPRYEVELAIGRLGLPYVRTARLRHEHARR